MSRPWIALAALAVACSEPAQPAEAAPAAEPPEIRTVDLAGFQAELAKRKGQPLLLNFWAIWCEPCVAELPDLIAVGKTFREQGGEVIGVSMDMNKRSAVIEDVEARMPGFTVEKGIDYPIWIFNDPDPFALTRALDLAGPIPETLAIDASGQVIARHAERASREEFEELAHKALGR